MIRKPVARKWRLLAGAASVLTLISIYGAMSAFQHRKNPDDTTIPSWRQLRTGIVTICEKNRRSGERWLVEDTKATLWRLFLGMSSGTVGALVVGVIMGCFALPRAFLLPPITLLAAVPPTAMLAVYFVLVGTDTSMYVTMIALGIGGTMARVVYLAVRDFPNELVYKAYTLGASNLEVIWSIIFRSILPKIIDTVRLHIPPAVIFLIAAEMVCADTGFGYRMRLQSRLLNMNIVYPYLALLAGLSFAMDHGLRLLQRMSCPWYTPEGR